MMKEWFIAIGLAACSPSQDGPSACAESYDAGRESAPYTLCSVGVDPAMAPLAHGAYCPQIVVSGTTRRDCYTELGGFNSAGTSLGVCTQPCNETTPCAGNSPTGTSYCVMAERLCLAGCPVGGAACPTGLRCETRATTAGDRRVCVPDTCGHL